MPSGEMRRPPQPWESKLARLTSIIGGAGVKSSGDGTSGVAPTPTPGTGGGTEPAPVLPPPGAFIAPSTPTLISSVQGINVVWNGLNSAGDLWPSDTSYVEVHMATSGPTFTPGTATLKGRLARPGGLAVTGLSAGTTYYFRLRGADPAGNVTAAGSAASAQPGQINAPDIAANAITANSIVAGTITGWSINAAYLSGGTIAGGYITGGTLAGGFISGGTVEGASYRTGSSGARVEIGSAFSALSAVNLYNASAQAGGVLTSFDGGLLVTATSSNKLTLTGNTITATADTTFDNAVIVSGTANFVGAVSIESSTNGRAFRVDSSGNVYSYGIDDNTTSGAANVRIGTSAQLLRSTSSVRRKSDLAPIDDDLAGVPADKVSDQAASVDPYDVLALTPTEFQSLSAADADARAFGFIAEDVAAKFPWACDWDDTGQPDSVQDRPIIAALVQVVKDLTARIEALEGN